MTQSKAQTQSRRKWLTIFSFVGTVLLVLLLWAFLISNSPTQIATVDDAHRWSENTAPPRRQIVWQPAVPLNLETDTPLEIDSSIRPQVSDGGNLLYFTLRTAGNDFDIVRSQRVAGGWSAPERVEELNSDADDIGPVIRDDGNVLYLYSDRDGGLGGMDVYVSLRDDFGWTKPVNLGPQINSPAHEYDPAISPDSQRLFFSSNRSEKMHRQMVAGTYDPKQDHWSTTLRNDPGNRSFDLYVADFDTESNIWNYSTSLAWLNTRDHNEGAPFVSPDGVFLMFTSDRPTHRDEPKNFDIYRARLDQPGLVPENLGVGINTPSSEMEPCLSAAGFQLLFSRSDRHNESQYALYQSTAKEVYRDIRPDQSGWNALGGALAGGKRKFLDYFWMMLLVLVTLSALVWLIRQIKKHRVAISSFLLAALLMHLFLVISSFFVFFQHEFAQRLKKMFEEEPVTATQVLFHSTAPNKAEQPAYDRVAELKMPARVEPANAFKESFDRPNVTQPIEFAKPQRIANHVPRAADVSSDPVVATVLIQDKPAEILEALRRAAVDRNLPSENVRMEQTIAVEVPQIGPVSTVPTEIERKELPDRSDPIEPIMVESPDHSRIDLQSMLVKLNETELQPTESKLTIESDSVAAMLERAAVEPPADSRNMDAAVPAEKITAVEMHDLQVPATQSVDLDRTVEMLSAALPQPEPLTLARPNESAPKPVDEESLVSVVAENGAAGSPTGEPPTSPLTRSRTRSNTAVRDSIVATESIKLVAQESQPASANPQPKVDVARQEANQAAISVKPLAMNAEDAPASSPIKSSEPMSSDPVSLIAASRSLLDRQSALSARVPLRQSSKPTRVYADAKLSLQSLLLRRDLDEATKAEVVKQFGGNDETLATIRRGLIWIEKHQASDGHWGLHDFHELCEGHKKCDGRGNSNSDTAGTALALLPFLGDGNTHKEGLYQEPVARAITWLLKNQKPDGNLFTGGTGTALMYSHGIATIALCECYGMTGDESLREPAQRAIDFIVAAQDPKSGGWRYRPREFADTSVVGWQVMALKSGQMAELNVPEKSLTEAQRWLDSVAGEKNRLGQFAYQGGRFNPAMTAEAILCLQYMGSDRESDQLTHGVEFLAKNLPKKGRENSYYWYYGTQAMFHFQGDHWPRWNGAIHPLLVSTQRKEGPMAGTWDPRDQWEKGGGRIYATSLRVLMLEVYYRHLPIYQVIE